MPRSNITSDNIDTPRTGSLHEIIFIPPVLVITFLHGIIIHQILIGMFSLPFLISPLSGQLLFLFSLRLCYVMCVFPKHGKVFLFAFGEFGGLAYGAGLV